MSRERVSIDNGFEQEVDLYDFEIAFNDYSDTCYISRASIIFEGNTVRFTCYKRDNTLESDVWYPMCNIAKIERFYEE